MKAEINIPEGLHEITLGQYQEFVIKSDGLEGDERMRCVVEVFCSLPKVTVMKIRYIDVKTIANTINEYFNTDPDFQLKFKIDTQEFGFINNMDNIEFGEYSDLDKYINDFENMHRAMAVCYRPVINTRGDLYDLNPYQGTTDFADLMRFMPLDIVLAARVFFWNLGQELLNATQSYLVEQLKTMETSQHKRNSTNSGDGITASMRFLEGQLDTLTKLPVLPFIKPSLF